MKIGLFSDSHYSTTDHLDENRYNSKSLERIEEAFTYFKKENCELVVCLGDLIDKENDHEKEISNLIKVRDVMNRFLIPTYVLMGNHDGFCFSVEEFYEILGKEYQPRDILGEEKNLIFLDTCYFKSGKHYQPGDWDWTDTFYPTPEVLEEKLSKLSADAYLFMHQNVDPEIQKNHRLYNDEQIRAIAEQSGKVKTIFQGHYHDGNNNSLNGILHFTMKAMCEYEDAYTVVEL